VELPSSSSSDDELEAEEEDEEADRTRERRVIVKMWKWCHSHTRFWKIDDTRDKHVIYLESEKELMETMPTVKLCQRGRCVQSLNLLLCKGCRLVSYCSRECQRLDWMMHKEVCHTSLPLRLKGVYRTQKDHGVSPLINLSHRENSVGGFSDYYRVSAFDGQEAWYCALCGAKTTVGTGYIYFEIDGLHVSYFRCHDCLAENKVICEKTFTETGACLLSNCGKVLLFTAFSDTTLMPELIKLVIRLFISLGCCKPSQSSHRRFWK